MYRHLKQEGVPLLGGVSVCVCAKKCLVCRWQEIGKIVSILNLDQSDESPLRERHTVKRLLLPLTHPTRNLRIFCLLQEHHLLPANNLSTRSLRIALLPLRCCTGLKVWLNLIF
jgi:hypothetical protein